MATDNKSLTIYLETEILDALTAYCLDNGIVRKDKTTPILATGAVDLMKQALGLSPTLTNTVQVRDEQTEKKLENLEARLETFEDAIAKLPTQEDDPTERIDEVISQLREKEISPILSRLENLEVLLGKFEGLENEIDDLKTPVGNDDPDPSPEDGLQNKQLAALLTSQRVNCRPEYISRYTNDPRGVPTEVKETLDLNWIKKGKLWYPRQETP